MEGTELQVFDLTTAALEKMKSSFMALKVESVSDSKGFDQVHDARMIVKKTRVQVEKRGLELRKKKKAEIEEDIRKINEAEKFIVGELSPVEDYLQSQEDIVTAEKARLKAEEEAKEQKRAEDRIASLIALGCNFDGQGYFYGTLKIPMPMLKAADDDQFGGMVSEIKKVVDADNEKKAQEEAARKAEEELLAKVKAEQEAEAARLAEIARKQEEEAARIKSEQERVEREAKEKREAEEKKLQEEREAFEAEKKRLADEEAARLKAIEDEKKRAEDEKRHQEELEQARKDAAEKARIEAEEKANRETAEKEEAERKEKEEVEAKAARAPDKDKLIALADSIPLVFPFPTMATDEGRAIYNRFRDDLDAAIHLMRQAVEEL